MRKITFTIIALMCCAGTTYAGGFSFGMTGAIKKRVEKLDEKVREKKAQNNQQPPEEEPPKQTVLLRDAINYTGSYPTPGSVSYTDKNNQPLTVDAYPGHVQVFFSSTTSTTDAETAITNNNGKIIGKIPATRFYLVQVTVGTEGAFITSMNQDSGVSLALPNIVLTLDDVFIVGDFIYEDLPTVPLNITGPVAIDTSSHGTIVVQSAESNGATITNIVSLDAILDDKKQFSVEKIVVAITAIADGINIYNPGQPIYINLSNGSGAKNAEGNWVDVTTKATQEEKDQAIRNWAGAMYAKLEAVRKLPDNIRSQIVITQSAGNCNMDVTAALTYLRNTYPELADVLKNNFFITGTNLTATNYDVARYPTGAFSNYITGTDKDFIYIDNSEAAGGTSYAAPALFAYLKQFVDLTGLTLAQATQDFKQIMHDTGLSPQNALFAAQLAMNTNANGQYKLSETLDKAQAISQADTNDPPGAENITGISFILKGATTSAVISPVMQSVSVQYTVSGTDGYYDSGTQQTNASGQVSFSIPAGASGVTDTISVIAVLSGKYARTTYTW